MKCTTANERFFRCWTASRLRTRSGDELRKLIVLEKDWPRPTIRMQLPSPWSCGVRSILWILASAFSKKPQTNFTPGGRHSDPAPAPEIWPAYQCSQYARRNTSTVRLVRRTLKVHSNHGNPAKPRANLGSFTHPQTRQAQLQELRWRSCRL